MSPTNYRVKLINNILYNILTIRKEVNLVLAHVQDQGTKRTNTRGILLTERDPTSQDGGNILTKESSCI